MVETGRPHIWMSWKVGDFVSSVAGVLSLGDDADGCLSQRDASMA